MLLDGPAPSPAVRARIAAFARANRVAIDLEVHDGTLVAVRFAVTYSGGCGYQGADVLALRFRRPHTGSPCFGDVPDVWFDDCAGTNDDGTSYRVSVRGNRLVARWEPPRA